MECKFDTFYMQSINCYILELSQCIKACIIYKLLILYYYTPFPPSLSYHSLPIFDHSFQQDPGIDNIYHPLTAIITTNLFCHSLPSIPILSKKAAFRQPPVVHLKPQLRSTLRSLSNSLCSRSVLHD